MDVLVLAQFGAPVGFPTIAKLKRPRAMNSDHSSSTVPAIDRIKQEIDQLAEEQEKALQTAIIVGMTPEEAREYGRLRKRITQLVKELLALERVH